MQLVLAIDRAQKRPLYRVLADALKKAIKEGRLKPGDSLPSVRQLADQYRLSRATVLRCYSDLQAEGWLRSAAGSATLVREDLSAAHLDAAVEGESAAVATKEIRWSRSIERLMQVEQQEVVLSEDLNCGLPAPDTICVQQWERSVLKQMKFDKSRMEYDKDVFGVMALRRELVKYLARSRGVRTTEDRVVVLASVQHGLDMLCRLLIDPGDAVAVENPGYPHARQTFLLNGARVVPFPVDDQGIIVDRLAEFDQPLKMVYVTPSHQDPTGCVMSERRRIELLEWARENGTVIVEDDFDSEYRYGREPLPALQGMDQADCVVHASTFWRSMGNLVQLAYMVLPRRITQNFRRAKELIQRDLPALEQYALADFISAGALERHIHKSRQLYQKRRQTLIHKCSLAFGADLSFAREGGGLHMLVTLSERFAEADILEAARRSSLPLRSTAGYYLRSPREREYLLSFALLSEQQICERTSMFASLLYQKTQSTTCATNIDSAVESPAGLPTGATGF